MITGVKFDQKKDRWDLLPISEIRKVVKVLTYGADKYPEADNWKRVPDHRNRYFAAAMRHITAWYDGEALDPDTGYSHLAHAICCLLFLMWKESNP